MASAPSNTAVATSETSARVGKGDRIIDSNICVATTTGLPSRRAERLMRFCRPGTFSSGTSTPRSPRATMRASETSITSSSRAIACGFSILAITSARPCVSFFTSTTSSGRCTKEIATQSTPSASAASRSARSLLVIDVMGMSVSGRLTPLRLDSRPATSTTARELSGVASTTCNRTLPSSIRIVSSTLRAARISGCGRRTRVASPGVGSESKTKLSPLRKCAEPSAKAPMRSFGPWRSTSTPMARPNSTSISRIIRT